MILEDVKLVDLDQNDPETPYYYRSRIVNITTDKGTFSTPSRLVTRTEHIARSQCSILRVLPQDITVDFRILIKSELDDLCSDSKTTEKLIQKVKQYNDLTRKAKLRLSIFQPAQNALDAMTTSQKINYADLQANILQLGLGNNLITFPYMSLPFSEYADFIDKRYRRDDYSSIFVLDLAMELNYLKKVLEHLIQKGEPMIIAFIYREWEKTALQHNLIASYFNNEKVAFLACQVPREIQVQDNMVSNLHSVAFGSGFDMVALEQSRSFGKAKKLDLNRIRFFSPDTLRIESMVTASTQPGRNIFDEFEIPANNINDANYLKLMLNGYRGALNYSRKFNTLLYLAKMHEALTSRKQFDISRDKIRNKEVGDLIKNTSLKDVPMILAKHT